MALRTEHKLYIAVGILAALGVASYFQKKSNKEVLAQHSYEGRSAELPKIQLSDERIKKVDKIVITQPPGDAGAAQEVVLVKEKDDKWKMEKPVAFPAWSDAALLSNEARIPSIVMGPGDLAQAHSADEWIAVAQVEEAALQYAALGMRFCGTK